MVSDPALVHDYLLVMRGAERTFAAIASCWPGAPIFTLLCDRERTEQDFVGHRISTSYLQRVGIGQARFRQLLPFYPRAAERLPVEDYDLVVSSSSAFAHGVHIKPSATHICYCHTPFRYAWHERDLTVQHAPPPLRPLSRALLNRIRSWDECASRRVTHYIANSRLTRERIQEYYGRDATIIHPPVDVDRFHCATPEDFFLVVSEVLWHKRVELALQAAKRARARLVVVGGGPDLNRLAQEYGSQATFMGRVNDDVLTDLYARARALVVPNIEEFGIAAVEAQASGRPVLAPHGGGATETVVPGETGVLVPYDDVDALAEAMVHTDFDRFSSDRICRNAARFSTEEFKRRLTAEVGRVTNGQSLA